ncbi:DNA internalization-related competence protein ComEC/Rec2 [Microbulbifer sp. A4B17]|uniref:DNA internalization-related competence protein ComEC/Rec2 n=1 Tax=Microbulbifer sp. A4B17 TaxID=359370 RepID=UPI0018645617|nr:DNA internalization-related competence protein ComEC/Rec2 [Microbulbifer sp. A4B17]
MELRNLGGSAHSSFRRLARVSDAISYLGPSAYLWSYSLSIIAVGCLAQLPAISTLGLLYLSLMLLAWWITRCWGVLALIFISLIGAEWALWSNQAALDRRLPQGAHGADFVLQLDVASLPAVKESSGFGRDQHSRTVRFRARIVDFVSSPFPEGLATGGIAPGSLLNLTWYRVDDKTLTRLRGGSQWILPVRLRSPRGSVNPNTFDYEGWLLREGVTATGYVRPRDYSPQWLGQGSGIIELRDKLRSRITQLPIQRSDLIVALLLGDRSQLSENDTDLLRRTGTGHLIAISGLHVGMVAGCFMLLGTLLAKGVGLFSGTSRFGIAVGLALIGSLGYTLVAGAPLSAQRAIVMAWVLLLAWHWRRRLGAGFAYSLALSLVLTLQPLAFYSAGFWLSFVAVGSLLLGFAGRIPLGRGAPQMHKAGAADKVPPGSNRFSLQWFWQLLRSQWLVAVGLFIPSILYFSGFSFSGVLVNLVAIPWVGSSILPPLMLGTVLIDTQLGVWLLQFAGWQLNLLMTVLNCVDHSVPGFYGFAIPSSAPVILIAGLGAVLILLPRGVPGRHLGWLFFLPVAEPWLVELAPAENHLKFSVLDVGQGLSVVISSGKSRIVYDTGPSIPSGWSAGGSIVAPYLMGAGGTELEALVVSHGDRDHAGGVEGLLRRIEVERVYAPGALADNLPLSPGTFTDQCTAGKVDYIGDISLRWLWPLAPMKPEEVLDGEENEHSCVILAEWQGVRLLLTGDISRAVELQLAKLYPQFPHVDILVAPHHGSRSSSSPALLEWARPKRVVFSAGFLHHFGHPHRDVVKRYQNLGVSIFNTAESGAIEFSWRQGESEPQIQQARLAPRFWYASHNRE